MNSYTKMNGQWVIRSLDADAANREIVVTKRNGGTKVVQLGDKVGHAFGHTMYAIAERAPQAAQNVGDLSRIVAMFDRARQHLRFPAVALDGFRVNVAGQRAREPGSLTITSADKGADGRRAWFGRVTLAGQFEPARDTPADIGDKLRRFAADPVGVAAEYGRLHGACCFCRKSLRDERSTAVGYGPTCAANFGLEWGLTERELEAA